MKSVFISIGNSDNKLTQTQWSNFVADFGYEIRHACSGTHFFGGASNWEPWQNVAWLIDIEEGEIPSLKAKLIDIRELYKQDSLAWVEGVTEFV